MVIEVAMQNLAPGHAVSGVFVQYPDLIVDILHCRHCIISNSNLKVR